MAGSDPVAGRLVLLLGAYAPAGIIAGIRGLPNGYAVGVLVGFVVVSVIWIAMVLHLRYAAQEETLSVQEIEPLDSEVAAYIASYLLPIAAATTPTTYDWIAYVLCGLLFGLIAFAAGLWSVNPLVYLLGLRVFRVRTVSSSSVLVLAKRPPAGTVSVGAMFALKVEASERGGDDVE